MTVEQLARIKKSQNGVGLKLRYLGKQKLHSASWLVISCNVMVGDNTINNERSTCE